MQDDSTVEDLVGRARSENPAAWSELVERSAPVVWAVCRRYGLSRADADEVGHTVWLGLLRWLADRPEPAGLPDWLAATAEHECLRLLTAEQRGPAEDVPAAARGAAERPDESLREAGDVPPGFVRAGQDLFVLRDLDIEVAALLHDSAADPHPAFASTRSSGDDGAAVRDVTFASQSLVISIQVPARGLHGQVAQVGVRRAGGGSFEGSTVTVCPERGDSVVAAVDKVGWFTLPSIPTGAIRLLCRTQAGLATVTGWIAL